MSEEEGNEIYCICRSTDVSRFMIGCDNCEEWYHGDCIDVTEKDANIIKKFYCKFCRKKNPKLEIKYKTKKLLEGRDKVSKEKSREDKQKDITTKTKDIKHDHKHKDDNHKNHKTKEEKSKDNKHKDHTSKEEKRKEKHKDKHKESKFNIENFSEKTKEKSKEDKHREDKQKENKYKEKNLEEKIKEKVKDEKVCDDKLKSEKHKDKCNKDDKHKESKHKHEKLSSGLKTGSKPASSLVKSQSSKNTSNTASNSEKTSHSSSSKVDFQNHSISSVRNPVHDAIKEVINKEKLREANKDSSGREGLSGLPHSIKLSTAEDKTQLHKNATAGGQSHNTSSKASKVNKSNSISTKNLNTNKSSNNSSCNKSISNNFKNIFDTSLSNSHSSSKSSNHSLSSKTSQGSPISKAKTSPAASFPSNNALNKQLSIDLSGSLVAGDRCGVCDPCRVPQNCGTCSACISCNTTCFKRRCKNLYEFHRSKGTPSGVEESGAPPCPFPLSDEEDNNNSRPRSVLKDRNDRYSDDDVWEPTRKLWQVHTDTKTKKKKKLVAGGRGGGRKRKGHPEGVSLESDCDGVGDDGGVTAHQCQGPECVQPARAHSKYCGDECGLKLAEKRIFAILPQRIQEWKLSGCISESQDTKKLERIRRQQLQAQADLQTLESKCKELDRIVERGVAETIDSALDDEMEDEGGEGQGVYCVTCGHEVATRRAVKHMENCFNKIESRTTFGSHFKTRIEGNTMFCDFYSITTRTYCKRLRVMCPEHYKEPKVPETRVCGAPLVRDVFSETGELCRASRKRCLKHYRWERLRRAQIDMERVRQWMKLDELLEQERQVRQSMTNRAGVLGLMLHSAYDHTLASRFEQQLKLQRQQRQQQEQQQQQRQQEQQQQQRQQQEQQQQQQQLQQQREKGQQLRQQQNQQQQHIKVSHKAVQQVSPQPDNFRVVNQSSVSQVQVLHSDHRYFQSNRNKDSAPPRTPTGVVAPRAQHTDHQYFRASGVTAATDGHLKLKVTQHKALGGPPQHPPPTHKTVIHLQRSSSGPLPYHQQQPQQPTRFGTGTVTRYYQPGTEPRYHEDHQYHHSTAPHYHRTQAPAINPRPPPPQQNIHSDHMYFTNKRQPK